MKASFGKAIGVAALACGVIGSVHAQVGGWGFECIDPDNTSPRSNDHYFQGVGNSLMRAHLGISGTVTYGGSDTTSPNPCYNPAITMNLAGRLGFMIGGAGSVQDTNPADPANGQFRDDFMTFTPGMPLDPSGSYCYVTINKDGTRTRFGDGGFPVFFVGFSNRYHYAEGVFNNVRVQLTVEVIGDAARMRWVLTNLDEDPANLGLWFGAAQGMLTADAGVIDRTGASQSGLMLGTLTRQGIKPGYVVLPTGKPPITEQRFIRSIDPANFPQSVDFLFGQTAAFGMRIDNGGTDATKNAAGQSDATEAAEFALGSHGHFAQPGLLGFPGDRTFPDTLIGDISFLDEPAFIQKFAEAPVPPNQSRTIVNYVRTNWGTPNYTPPYAVVVDAPQLVATDGSNLNGVRPNPMTIRVYVDNYNFAVANQEVPLNDVDVTLTLPPGLTLTAGQNNPQTIDTIAPAAVAFVEWTVESDGIAFGNLAYSVKVEPIPGPTKTINGIIRVATTPKLYIAADANLVTAPWNFQDNSWESVLQLSSPQDFQAFKWDPQAQGYIPATNAERGRGAWIVTSNEFGAITLGGNPTTPPDIATGAPLIQLKSGWNLIGNPYNYPIPIGQLVGVSASNPTQSFRWSELVAQGVVASALVYWDTDIDDYVFIGDVDALIMPNRGYWLFVGTVQDLTLSYPAVYIPGLPGSSRSSTPVWVQSDKQWKLQLVARSPKSVDAQNFVGLAKSVAQANSLKLMEPPMSPSSTVGLAIKETVGGQIKTFAQSLSERTGRREWRLVVTATEAGTVTVTWPNLATIPQNVRLRLTDLATNLSRDPRQTSGYTFEMAEAGVREFKLEASPGTATRAVIGNVVVSRPDRSISSPFTIHYTLASEATTTVRILSGSGKEVFTASRGRADRAGENTVTWALRDNANRLVAPGVYRVEIIADTANGDRARKVIPINVVR